LFKRVHEVKKIVEGIMKSLPSLSYACIALCLIIAIWAVIGVDLFSEMNVGGSKGYYFGTFLKSFLTLCQITTFDSWSSGIARDIIYEKGVKAAVYFCSFVFVSGIIMMNVMVALLLDTYLTTFPEEEGIVSEEDVEAKKALFGVDPQFKLIPKVQNGEDCKKEKIKLPVKIRKGRSRSLSDKIATKRKISDVGLKRDSGVQKAYNNEFIKKLLDNLKEHYNQVQVGMKIVRNELLEVKSLVELVESTIEDEL